MNNIFVVDDPVFVVDDPEADMAQSFVEIQDAIEKRKAAPDFLAVDAERDVCVEARSLMVAFIDLTHSKGFDHGLASRVHDKLAEALGVLTADESCSLSVRRQLERNFGSFIQRTDTNSPHAIFSEK